MLNNSINPRSEIIIFFSINVHVTRFTPNKIDDLFFRGDKIFWIIVEQPECWYHCDIYGTKIFELFNRNTSFYLKSFGRSFGSFGSFESSLQRYFQIFPKEIRPSENGKFIFYPQYVQNGIRDEILFIEVEEFEESGVLNLSYINFPLNTSYEFYIFLGLTFL